MVSPCAGFEIPYRQILPEGVENLLVAGKPLHRGGLRSIPVCMLTGEAAGTAAALAAKGGGLASTLDIDALQTELRAKGVNLGYGR